MRGVRAEETATIGAKLLDRDKRGHRPPGDCLRRALTPQCFRFELLQRAYEQVDVTDPALTDESVMVERLGATVVVVEGSSRNIKITRPEDLAIGEALLKMVGGF